MKNCILSTKIALNYLNILYCTTVSNPIIQSFETTLTRLFNDWCEGAHRRKVSFTFISVSDPNVSRNIESRFQVLIRILNGNKRVSSTKWEIVCWVAHSSII